MPFKYRTPIERLAANSICTENNCWNWISKKRVNNSGMYYGVLNIRRKFGKRRGTVKTVRAHRYSLSVSTGIPLYRINIVRHKCNNSLCVNPDHLIGGTQRQNMRDRLAA